MALDCQTGQNKGRYCEKELSFLLVSLWHLLDFQKSIFCVFEDLPHMQDLLNEKVAECDPHDFCEKLPSNAFSSPT